MPTPILFYNSNKKDAWKRALKKAFSIYELDLSWNIELEDLVENYIHKLPLSFFILNCEDLKLGKEEFVNKLETFNRLTFNEDKICIIHGIDKASNFLQNAILKNLEEDNNIQYLLTASSISQIIPTILSRLIVLRQIISFTFIDKIKNIAMNYNIMIEEKDINEFLDKLKEDSFVFIIPKLENEKVAQFVLVAQQYYLKEIKEGKRELESNIIRFLFESNKFLNLWAINRYSKNVAISTFLNAI